MLFESDRGVTRVKTGMTASRPDCYVVQAVKRTGQLNVFASSAAIRGSRRP